MPGTVFLPANGREGDPPVWPLGDVRPKIAAIWAGLWSCPQAAAWERFHHERMVARYCLLLPEVECEGAPVSLLAEARQLEDRLGLNPLAMLRLRWEIAPDEVAEARTGRVEPSEAIPKRLRAVDPGVAGS